MRSIIGPITPELKVLDLCCCEMTGTQRLFERVTAIDVVDWKTRPARHDFTLADGLVYLLTCGDHRFDVAICSDGIEHFSKARGWEVLAEMQRVARLSIIFTPLGNFCADENATHPDHHKSAWWPHEFARVGWDTLVYPNWHATWNHGAFFAYTPRDTQ